MSDEELTITEAKEIYEAIHPTLGFLTLLERRLGHLRFGPNNNYYELLAAAREALHALSVETHYQSCVSGVGPPRRSEAKTPRQG